MKKKYFSLVFLLKNTKKILVGIKPPYLESLFLESKLIYVYVFTYKWFTCMLF